jgi:Flp pilus assembly CpaE family ATPase
MLAVCPEATIARELQEVLAELAIPAVIQAAYPRPGTIARLAAQHGCNLCLLEVASDQELALKLIGEMASTVPVVVLHPRQDAELILKFLRSGAAEFLSDAAVEPMREVLARLAKIHGPQKQQPKKASVCCVIPGKPGCGASTVAIHLAMQTHANGKAKVLLVDMDPATGSLGFMLKLRPEFHLGDVLRDWHRMDDDLWSRLTVQSGGVDVVAGAERPGLRIEIDRGIAGQLLDFWRERYDMIVVDGGDLRSAIESGFAELADDILLVATQDLAALHATRRGIELLDRAEGTRGKVRLVINRYGAGGIKREDLRTALQVEPFATVLDGLETLEAAVLRGEPAAAGVKFRQSVLALARQLHGALPAEKKTSSWRSLLPLRK